MPSHDSYVIEVGELAAGIVVRDSRRYRFYASDSRFSPLEGRAFRGPQAAWAAARALLGDRPARRRWINGT
jgi:hypothetical protein